MRRTSCRRRSQNAVGNYGTVNFLCRTTQFDWRVQAAAERHGAQRKPTRLKVGTGSNHVFVDPAVRLQPVRDAGPSMASAAGAAGGHECRWADSQPLRRTKKRRWHHGHATGSNWATSRWISSTDELAFYAQDTWRPVVSLFHVQLRIALGGRVEPDAGSQQRLHAQRS